MAFQIVAVRMEGGTSHEHIAGAAMVYEDSNSINARTRKVADIIRDINAGQRHFTRDYAGEVAEVVVVGSGSTAYIRTKKDGVMRDNLLRLPRYTL